VSGVEVGTWKDGYLKATGGWHGWSGELIAADMDGTLTRIVMSPRRVLEANHPAVDIDLFQTFGWDFLQRSSEWQY
jgi:hypothetical protein